MSGFNAADALPQLRPQQVVQLQDELLANADRLLVAALAVLDLGQVALARSLSILGMEESGKAIALHERRVRIAFEPEGSAFVDEGLRKLWANHKLKLKLVHSFLVEEKYWFDTQPPDPDANEAWLGEIEGWVKDHNVVKQRGFYVDINVDDGVLTPEGAADEASLRQVISHVHQIGWQLRLGEHIEAKGQRDFSRSTPGWSEEQIAAMKTRSPAMSEWGDEFFDGLRKGREGTKLNNDAFRVHLLEPGVNPFANVGRPGYEAETREIMRLADQVGLVPKDEVVGAWRHADGHES